MAEQATKTRTEKVTFTVDAGVPGEDQFQAGKSYELNPQSAYRWVRRGVARYVDEKAQKAFAVSDGNTPPAA